MAGVVGSLFPEWKEAKEALSDAGNAYLGFTKSMWRGIGQAPFSMVDLAGFLSGVTPTGAVKPEDVVGSSAWAEKKGLLLPKAKEGYQFLNEMGEMGGGMLAPGMFGGMVGPAASAVSPAARTANKITDMIPRDLGQIENDVVKMRDAAKLARDPAFAQRAAGFRVLQNDSAERVLDGFRNALAKAAPDKATIGKKIQESFDAFVKGENMKVSEMNKTNYDKALRSAGSKQPFLMPKEADDVIEQFISDSMATGLNPDQLKALAQLRKDWYGPMGTRQAPPPPKPREGTFQPRPKDRPKPEKTTIFGIDSNIKAINEKFSEKAGPNSPYAVADSRFMDRVRKEVRKAYDVALDSVAANPPDEAIGDAASGLKGALEAAATNATRMQEMKEQMLLKLLGRKEDEYLNVESLADSFSKLSKAERTFFEGVAAKHAPELVENVRRKIFDDMFNAGANVGGNAGESTFNIQGFLNAHDGLKTKNPELYDWVIGESKPKLDEIVQQAREAVNFGTTVGEDPGKSAARTLGAGAAGITSGRVGAARTADAAFGFIENLTTDKEGLYQHLFHGGPQPKGKLGVIKDKVMPSAADGGGTQTGLQLGAGAQGATLQTQEPSPVEPAQPQYMPPPAPPVEQEFMVDPADLQDWNTEETPSAPSSNFKVDPKDLEGW